VYENYGLLAKVIIQIENVQANIKLLAKDVGGSVSHIS
jgi:hypothetical protein